MATIEREYEYKSRWTAIVFGALLFGACAVGFGFRASTNEQGLVINGIIYLSKNGATIFYWSLSGLSFTFVAVSALLTVQRFTQHQRLVFTERSMTLPRSRWTSEEITIPYDDITSLLSTTISGQRLLYVFHKDGKKFTIAASLLPKKDSFDEIGSLLQRRLDKGEEDEP